MCNNRKICLSGLHLVLIHTLHLLCSSYHNTISFNVVAGANRQNKSSPWIFIFKSWKCMKMREFVKTKHLLKAAVQDNASSLESLKIHFTRRPNKLR